jgi:hypothetical protein
MKDGIHHISIEEYHANTTHLSSTQIKKAKQSITHFFHKEEKQERKSHFDFGNAFECALIDKEAFQRTVAIEQDQVWFAEVLAERPEITGVRSTKEYKQKKAEFLSENEGKYIIKDVGSESYETIEKMMETCYKDQYIKAMTVGSEYQPSYFWTDPETGIRLKSRPDIIRKTKKGKNVMIDVKTGTDFSPREFKFYLMKYDLPIQAILQIDGFEQCTGESLDEYYWLGCEKTPPYMAQMYRFGADKIEWIREDFKIMKSHIKQALEEKRMVGYGDRGFDPYGRLEADIPLYYSTYIVE